MSVLDTLVKEAEEEASLPADIIRTQAVAAGAVSYFYVREASAGGEEGLLQPEVQYVYDLAITEDIIPKPNDDEVEAFSLMPLHEVLLSFNWLIAGTRSTCGRSIQTELCICFIRFLCTTWNFDGR